MIGGFEQPDAGSILLRGVDVTTDSPNRRNVNMVFQHYALFPHMSIGDNIAFGMRLKKVPKGSSARGLPRCSRSSASKVSRDGGPGNSRAVSSAWRSRALVNRPAALLLDEPLGALDVKLRRQMQLELKRIQAELGTTFVYVTHDQEEALAMSDRIAVMNDGVVEQVGSPREMYESRDRFLRRLHRLAQCARVPGRRGRGQAARLPRLADRAPGRGGRERALPG